MLFECQRLHKSDSQRKQKPLSTKLHHSTRRQLDTPNTLSINMKAGPKPHYNIQNQQLIHQIRTSKDHYPIEYLAPVTLSNTARARHKRTVQTLPSLPSFE